MTSIIGVLCNDGVVMGADSSATFVAGGQLKTIEQRTDKINIIDHRVIVAGTGMIGLDQRFCEKIKEAWDQKVFRGSPVEVGRKLSRAGLIDFKETMLGPGLYGALVAFPCEKEPCLLELDEKTFQPELKNRKLWYASMGSAQPITDPFLALMRTVFWEDSPPSTADGIFAVAWTLQHAIDVNPGGVNGPLRIAVLERDPKADFRAKLLDERELAQHQQNVEEAVAHLREFRKKHQPTGAAPIPPPPDSQSSQ